MRPMSRLLKAMDAGSCVTLDLTHAPVTRPRHVAAVLWLEGEAERRGLDLAIEAIDMVSAELLAFSGIDAAVRGVEPVADGSSAAL
jgi:hypothetical protein